MKRVFARIGMEMNVTDEEFERLKDKYTYESELSVEDAKMFMEKGELLVDNCTDSYIPQSEFEEPRIPDVLTWDEIYRDAMETEGASYFFLNLKVKDNARAYITDYAMELGVDIEGSDCPEDAIDDFLKEHPECNRFNSEGQMLIAIEEVA
jgi:hypothetical protein